MDRLIQHDVPGGETFSNWKFQTTDKIIPFFFVQSNFMLQASDVFHKESCKCKTKRILHKNQPIERDWERERGLIYLLQSTLGSIGTGNSMWQYWGISLALAGSIPNPGAAFFKHSHRSRRICVVFASFCTVCTPWQHDSVGDGSDPFKNGKHGNKSIAASLHVMSSIGSGSFSTM